MKRTLPLLAGLGALAVPAAAHAATYLLQPVLICPEDDPLCGFDSFADFDAKFETAVLEINLEYRTTGISYQALPVKPLMNDDVMTITGKPSADQKDENQQRKDDLIAGWAATDPGVITLFLKDGLGKCWNGLACPGDGDEYDEDEVVFCSPPRNPYKAGRTYAHELGHFWCLRHTFTWQDPGTNNPVDRDNDDLAKPSGGTVCDTLVGVWDTPADPGVFEKWDPTKSAKGLDEDMNKVHRDGHEWCTAQKQKDGVDKFSPHGSYCTSSCVDREDGVEGATSEAPFTQNAMSYYSGMSCRGPYSMAGVVTEPFTPGQADEMQECLAEVPLRAGLIDVCAGKGDTDHDGWCDGEDKCPFVPNTSADYDKDGIPDKCDSCPGIANAGDGDDDHDGHGNACDKDADNDGCNDDVDQHPHDRYIPVGVAQAPNCPHPEVIYEDESLSNDGDKTRDCRDVDDDNDGVNDDKDPCIISADEKACHPFSYDICDPIYAQVCEIGNCGWLDLVVNPGYPDPTKVFTFDSIEQKGEALFVRPLAGRTLLESARALAGELDFDAFSRTKKVSLQVMSKKGHEPVARLLDFEPGDGRVRIGRVGEGQLLRIDQTKDGLVISSVWAVGEVAGEVRMDADEDGVPDFADSCVKVADPTQADRDGDGFGDVCDADLDQDGRVSDRDVELAWTCAGLDLEADYTPVSCEYEEVREDPQAEAMQPGCEAFDMDGDGVVGERDIGILKGRVGEPVGPSGFAPDPRR